MHPQVTIRIAIEFHSTELTRLREGNSSRVPTDENHQQDLTRRKIELHKPSTIPEHGQVRRQHRDSFFISCKRGESNLPNRPRGRRGIGMMTFHISYTERRTEDHQNFKRTPCTVAENLDLTLLRLEEEIVTSRSPSVRPGLQS